MIGGDIPKLATTQIVSLALKAGIREVKEDIKEVKIVLYS